MCSIGEATVPAERGAVLARLEQDICELAAQLAAGTCRWLELIREFDLQAGWADWGATSCVQWLSWRCGIAPSSAREHVRVARALGELSLVRGAFSSGELSYSKVRAITRVATVEIETELLELARHASGAQLERLVRSYRSAAERLDAANRAHASRALRWHHDEDGSLVFEGRLPADEGAALIAALEASASAEAPPTPAANADALVTLAREALAQEPVADSDAERCQVVVHVDVQAIATEPRRGERCELAGGEPLAGETARRLSCDASVVRILEREGRPLSVGRRTRTVPTAIRRALRSRDNGCRFPGCTHARFLHAHHVQHWARGGPTSIDNLVQLCSHHHRLVHEGGYGVRMQGDGEVVFRTPAGQPIPPVPAPRKADGGSLQQRIRRQAPAITADTCFPLSSGQPLDYGMAVDGLLAAAVRC
jgi:hypothetical protein